MAPLPLSSVLSLLSRLRPLPMVVGDARQRDGSLCEASLWGEISRSERDAVVAAVLADSRGDRSVGCLVGMAIGDAVGHPLEFIPVAEDHGPGEPSFDRRTLTYTSPRNEFLLRAGQWTDDASMGLCLADSLLVRRGYDGSDLRARFWNWWYRGYNNAFRLDPARSTSVGLGGNIAASLRALRHDEPPPPRFEAGTRDAGNGSLMRLAAVPIFHHRDVGRAVEVAAESSYTTHPGPIAAEACAFLARLLTRAIERGDGPADARSILDEAAVAHLASLVGRTDEGAVTLRALLEARQPADSLERNWNWRAPSLDLAGTLRRRGHVYRGYPLSAGYFGAYCVDGLAMALHSVYQSQSFDEAIERCVNLCGDADSTGAIAGQIAGAIHGHTSIDPRLVEQLQRWDEGEIAFRGALLHSLGEAPG